VRFQKLRLTSKKATQNQINLTRHLLPCYVDLVFVLYFTFNNMSVRQTGIESGSKLLPSVADPRHFGVDPDPRIHAFD
jgi:hypothetical protein